MNTDAKVRIDKWLWAARFFKTRSLAKHAIEGGKVHCDGQRVKASKEISVGIHLTIRQDRSLYAGQFASKRLQYNGIAKACLRGEY